MNLDAQIEKCSNCRAKLANAIGQVNESTSPDEFCKFGVWLLDEARTQYSSFATYEACVQVYSKCHVLAEKIASDIDNKKYAEAQVMLARGAPIAVLSTSMAVAIMHLKRDTGTWY
jgi:hypothetical protein